MRTNSNVLPQPLEPGAQPAPHPVLPTAFVVMAILMAGLSGMAIVVWKFYPLAIGFLPLIISGVARPQALMMMAIALAPFSVSLTGDRSSGVGAVFGISDVFLLLAVPGLVVQALRRTTGFSLGKLNVPIGLFLMAGLVSFYLNIPAMASSPAVYFVGFLRTLQIVLIVPLGFAVLPWRPDELRNILRGYLLSSTFLATCGIIAFFAGGMREGLYILGNHKNLVGLALALGALIAAAALTQPPPETPESKGRFTPPVALGMSRPFLIAALTLCIIGLICSLSRGSYLGMIVGMLYIAVARRQPKLFVIIFVSMVVILYIVMFFLPQSSADYVQDISASNRSNYSRIHLVELSLQELRQNWAFGDGFRARRDFFNHNLEMSLLAETGLVGTGLFIWVLVTQTWLFVKSRQYFSGDPMREWICVAGLACSIGLTVQSQFDPYWRRGPLWVPWAGIGIVLAMLNYEQRQQRLRRRKQVEETEQEGREQRRRVQRLKAEGSLHAATKETGRASLEGTP